MILKIKHFVIYITVLGYFSCKEARFEVSEIDARQIVLDESIKPSDTLETFISPYRKRVNEVLDSTLAYAPFTISKSDGTYNTTAGNLMADIIWAEANPIFNSRTGKKIDFVLLNHGGIRSVISKGKVNARTAYEVMPFENKIVVVELRGKSIQDLVGYLTKSRRPHPIAGIQVVLDKSENLYSVKIQGKPLNLNQNYWVATSDYLLSGGDDMGFFQDALKVTETDYLIRNAMIDYFKRTDTLSPVIDDRYYRRQ